MPAFLVIWELNLKRRIVFLFLCILCVGWCGLLSGRVLILSSACLLIRKQMRMAVSDSWHVSILQICVGWFFLSHLLWWDKSCSDVWVFTSRAVWRWPRTALCSGVSPSLARKSIWAPPSARTRMDSPPPGSHCTARDRGVSGGHTQIHTQLFMVGGIILQNESQTHRCVSLLYLDSERILTLPLNMRQISVILESTDIIHCSSLLTLPGQSLF